jgi:5-methylcytosine-specific restriction endonuclease McrA
LCKDLDFIFKVQSLLDEGNSLTKVASKLNVHHSKVCRLLTRGLIEIYTAFDEDDKKHLYQNFEWLWEEDELEKVCDVAFDELYVNINELLGENYFSVSKYTKETYGDLFNYLQSKNKTILKPIICKECTKCGEAKPINNFYKKKKDPFGINIHCKSCNMDYVRTYCRENPDFMKRHLNNRRAKKKKLRDDLTKRQVAEIMDNFDYCCVLTGSSGKLHLDHVIPLAVGHGGTTYGNMVPLRADLNSSKNDSNIFEWFEANRQRFELSQERFDNLIAWLASANAMTVEEYRDYVYWCHANPRNIDELEAQ